MNRFCVLALVTFLVWGCQSDPPEKPRPESTEPVAAKYRDGYILLSEVEERLRAEQAFRASPTGVAPIRSRDEWLTTLSTTARHLAFERWLIPENDLESLPELADIARQALEQSTVDLYLNDRQARELPSEAEVEAFYSDHSEMFEQAGQRFVSHIFRRQRPGEPESAPAEFLLDLKLRISQGETFRALAARHSDSETRLLEGRLGWIQRGRLPKALEEAVFALRSGEMSDPILVPGGATLFLVTDTLYAKSYSLQDARPAIMNRLLQLAQAQELEDLASRVPLPADSLVLDDAELASVLNEHDADQVILRLGEHSYKVADWLEDVAERDEFELSLVDPKERAYEIYRRHKHRQLAFLRASEEGFPSEAPLQERLRASIGKQLRRELIASRSQARMMAKIDQMPQELRDFHRQNDHLFQSPLRLEIVTLEVPLGNHPMTKIQELESLRELLQQGEVSFDQVATQSAGTLTPAQWLGPQAISALSPKVRIYLLGLKGTGFSVPFQLDRQLLMIWVKSRQEPRILGFEEVEDRVRDEYFARHRQRLFQQLLQDGLKAQSFELNEQVLKESLAAPGEK